MMQYMIPLIVALTATLDYLFWRSRHATLKPTWRVVIYGTISTTLLLPLLTQLEGVLRTDNIPEQMVFRGSLMLLIFLFAALPRMVIYGGWLSRHPLVRLASVGGALAAVALLAWSVGVGRIKLRINQVTVTNEQLPEGWRGCRIVHFTDLHLGSLLKPEEECRRLVDTILSLRPDLILFTGDLVNVRHTELDTPLMRQLGRLKAPLGVYSVTGNHDVGVYIKDSISLPHAENTRLLISKVRSMGWEVLENQSRTLTRNGDAITLTGIGFEPSLRNLRHARKLPEDYHPWGLYDAISDSLFNLTICHLPQLWDDIRQRGFGDLTLAGHVHSMQHKLPIGKRGWSLSALFYKRWSGRYDEEGATLYINDGIASIGIPARLGAPPEISCFTLDNHPAGSAEECESQIRSRL